MKTIIQAALIGALAMAANVHAQDGTPPGKVWAEDLSPYLREFKLANGETLKLTSWNGLIYAKLSSGMKHRVVPAERGTFVAVDGTLSLHIEPGEAEAASGWVTSGELPDARLAAITPPTRER